MIPNFIKDVPILTVTITNSLGGIYVSLLRVAAFKLSR